MEERKVQFNHTQKFNFLLNQNNNSLYFNTNNNTKVLPPLLDLKNLDENKTNNEDIINNNINNTSPKTNDKELFRSTLINPSFPTSNNLYNSFKTTFRKPSLKINTSSQNDKITPNININTISNSFKKNKISLKRLNTGIRPSAFHLKNRRPSNIKLNNHIKFRNSNKCLDTKQFANALKNKGEDKEKSLLTERNKKNVFNLKRPSINSNKSNHISFIKTVNKTFKRTKTLSEPKYYGKSTIFVKKNKNKYKLKHQNKYQNKHQKKHQKKPSIPIIVNPLLIAEEDKIFDEMKKYLCFKYEKKKLKSKSNAQKKDIDKNKGNFSKIKPIKNKIKTNDQIKLNYLYFSTSKVNKKIRYIKRKKDKQDLEEYQNNLLDVIKPSVSDYTYAHLKDKFIDIRLKNNIKYQNNYKKIKEIENIEEDIINDINKLCRKCLRTFQKVREQKEMVHYTNLKIKLPSLNFISCLKKKKKIKKKANKTVSYSEAK